MIAAAVLAAFAGDTRAQLFLYAASEAAGQTGITSVGSDGVPTAAAGSPIATGVDSEAAAVRGDQAFVYVPAGAINLLKVIDSSTQSVVQTIGSSGDNGAVAVSL